MISWRHSLLFIASFLLLGTINSFGQTPANDECSGAITLIPGTQLLCPGATSGTTTGATQSTTFGQPDCSFGNIDDDVWYKFVAINDKHIVSMTGGNPMYYPAFEVYSGTCGSLTTLGICNNGPTAGTSAIFNGLGVGNTYYIRAYSHTTSNGYRGSFTICVTSIPNDECIGAPSLSINSTCVPVFGDTKHSTKSNNAGEPLCSGHTGWNDDDLWFKFTTPSNPDPAYIVDVDANPFTLGYRLTSPNMSFYTGSCGNLNLLSASCTTPVSGCPYRQVVSLSGLAANTTYYVRVYSWVSPSSYRGQFNICVSTGTGTGTSTITATPDSLAFGTLCLGDSLTKTFTLNGSNLSAGSVVVGPLAGYSFSTNNINFSNTLSIATCGGSFSQTIYVRFKPVLAQTYTGNIPVSGTSVTPINVFVSGLGGGGIIPGTPTLSATSTTICPGGSVTLSVQSGNLNGANGWRWYSGTCGGISSGSGSSVSVSPLASTTYFARGEGGNCISTGDCDSIRIIIENVTALITPSSGELSCNVTDVSLTASGGSNYTWSNGVNTAAINVNIPGNYTVTVSGNGTCSATASVSVTQNITTPNASLSPTSTSLPCNTSSVSLAASGGGNYNWSNGASSASINVANSGIYTVTVTDPSNGCTASASAVVLPQPSVNITINRINTSCGLNNGSADASGSTGSGLLSFQWNNGDTTPSIINLGAGNYSVTVQDTSGCSATASVIINSSVSGPVSLVSDKDTICAQDSVHICSPSDYKSYLWNTGDTSSCIYAKSSGNYLVTVTDDGNCSAVSDTKTVTVFPVPSVSIIVRGDTLSSFGGVSYQWILDGIPISGATGAVYVAEQSGNYQLSLTDAKGCTTTSSPVKITVESTGITSNPEDAIEIFPNPNYTASWFLKVGSSWMKGIIRVFDVSGRVVYVSQITQNPMLIALNVSSGVYFLQIDAPVGHPILKLLKL